MTEGRENLILDIQLHDGGMDNAMLVDFKGTWWIGSLSSTFRQHYPEGFERWKQLIHDLVEQDIQPEKTVDLPSWKKHDSQGKKAKEGTA